MQSVSLALEQTRRGGIVLLSERGGAAHLVVAAERATAQSIRLMSVEGGSPIQLAITPADRDRFQMRSSMAPTPAPPGIAENLTRLLGWPISKAWTLLAEDDGVLDREGLAEAAVDLARLSGASPVALLCTLGQGDKEGLVRRHGLPVLHLSALAQHRRRTESVLDFVAEAEMPTAYSDRPFRAHSFQSRLDGVEHLALVAPGQAAGAPLVRIHSECLTGDAFGSLRCDCGPQLQESLRRLAATPGGILVYMRGHEGRGIGLANKMRAYALQDLGMDTVEANRALGLPDDARNYAHAAQILRALGHQQIRLLSNNPEKSAALQRHGITVTAVEPLIMPPNPFNARYLQTKAQKFGHALPVTRPH